MGTSTETFLLNSTYFVNESEEHSGKNDSLHPGDKEYHSNLTTFCIITFVAAAIAIVGILLTLFSYIGYRKFRVKRTHIIVVNLCICLLLYFISYAISNPHRQYVHAHGRGHELCIAGAFICHFAVLCAWFWISVYWFLLLVMFQRPLGGHINHFFLKASVPSYGIPLLAALIAILVAFSNGHIHDEEHLYFSERCFVANNYLYISLIVPFAIVWIPILAVCAYVVLGIMKSNMTEREQRDKLKVKSHLIKLSIITIFMALVLLSTVIVPAVKENTSSVVSNWVAVICFAVGSIALGLLLMFLFCINQKDIRRHWIGVVTGKGHQLNHRTMSRAKHDVVSGYGSRKSSMANSRQPMLYVDEAEESERKSSTIRIVPKDDADMSTLGLIQIPGTPSPVHHPITKKASVEKDSSDEEGKKGRKPSTVSNNNEARRSSKAVRRESSKSKKDCMGHPKLNAAKRMKSVDKIISKSCRKDFKRRSFSTSCITPSPEGMQLTVAKRQSVLSTESTQTTNFD